MDDSLEKKEGWFWAAVLLLILGVPSFRGFDYKDFASSLGFFTCLVLFAIRLIRKNEIRFSFPDGALLLYAGWMVLTTTWAPEPSASLEFLKRFLPWVGIFFLIRQENRAERFPRMEGWVLGTAVVGIYGLLQKLGLDFIPTYAQNGSASRIFSTFGNPSVFSAFLTLSWPILILRPISGKDQKKEWALRGLLGFLLLLDLFFTESRAGLLALFFQLLGLFFFTWVKVSKNKGSRWGLALSSALLAGILAFMAVKIGNRPTERWEVWKGAAAMALEHPFQGWGVNQFSLHFEPYQSSQLADQLKKDNTFAEHVHEEPLELWVESGLIGVFLGAFFWISLLGRAFQKLMVERKNRSAKLTVELGLFLGLVGAGITNLFDYNCRLSGMGFFIWLAAGLLANRLWETKPQKVPKVWSVLLALVFFVLAGWGGVRQFRALAGQWSARGEHDFLTDLPADLTDEEKKTVETIRTDPKNPSAFHELGNIYAKMGKMDEAEKAYQEEIVLNPKASGAYLNLGNIYFLESGKDPGDLNIAISDYRKVLELDPISVEAHFNLAYAFFVQKDLSDALGQVEEVLKLDPQNAKALSLKRQILP